VTALNIVTVVCLLGSGAALFVAGHRHKARTPREGRGIQWMGATLVLGTLCVVAVAALAAEPELRPQQPPPDPNHGVVYLFRAQQIEQLAARINALTWANDRLIERLGTCGTGGTGI